MQQQVACNIHTNLSGKQGLALFRAITTTKTHLEFVKFQNLVVIVGTLSHTTCRGSESFLAKLPKPSKY